MRDLVKKALDRWRRASRADAPAGERMEALCTIPELCTALETVAQSAGGDGPPAGADGHERDRFARHVAHEIRNRLNMVEVALMRLETSGALDDAHATLEPVRGALQNLGSAVEDLGGVETRDHPALGDHTRQPLATVIRELASASIHLARERGIDLEVADDLPDTPVHAGRFELALVNLLANALDHSDPAKERRRVRIEVEPWEEDGSGPAWRIGVLDNGVGIPAAMRDRVFEESFRGDGGPAGGRGLGLTVAREAVEREGGRIWLESEEGAGTSVYFTLPDRP